MDSVSLGVGNFINVEEPVLKALYNDVILKNIFMNVKNRKNCRLVCKKWNSEILSVVPTRFQLYVRRFICHPSSTVDPKLERKLVKKIFVDYDVQLYEEDESLQAGDLRTFCKEYGQEIENIEFICEAWDFADLKYIFENNLCPNLRGLEGFIFNVSNVKFSSLPTMPNLEFIAISFADWIGRDNLNFLQLLIKNSPNLKAINYDGPFEKDFSANKKLVSIQHFLESGNFFDAEKLKKTLARTAQSLEKLRLEFLYAKDDDESDDDIDDGELLEAQNARRFLVAFPNLPKLTTLELISAHNAQIGRHLDNLTPKVLPNLRNLSLSTKPKLPNRKPKEKYQYGSNTELTILKELAEWKGSYQHPKVVKLSLKGVGNPQLLKDLRSSFPNLESLEVELVAAKRNIPKDILSELMKALKDLKLKKLKIIMPSKYNFLDLVEALEPNCSELFKGMRQFVLENLKDSNIDTLAKKARQALCKGRVDPIATFERILMQMKEVDGLKTFFHNIVFNAATAQRVMKFIEDEKIPITFTC